VEGIYTKDGKRNGWCITFNGYYNTINYGWYKDDLKEGNHWVLELKTW